MGNLLGLMEDATEENGLMENNMAKVHMLQARDKKNTENGKRERELDGLEGVNKIEFITKKYKFYSSFFTFLRISIF